LAFPTRDLRLKQGVHRVCSTLTEPLWFRHSVLEGTGKRNG